MKLASLKSKISRDGELIVVSRDNKRATKAHSIAPSLRAAIESWTTTEPLLKKLFSDLENNKVSSFPIVDQDLVSPLPRTFQWADASAFIQHVRLVRMARNVEPPESLKTVPLMYQGAGDQFLAPTEDIPQIDPGHGTDFEGEVGVIVNDVPMGVTATEALKSIILFVLINDVSLRSLIPFEISQGFGFFHSKPASSLAPFAVTEEELEGAWREGRIHLPLHVELNGEFFGKADAGEMHFHFGELIAHAARTRHLTAGTTIGSGTVSNEDISKGSSCIAERRMLEKIHEGVIKTPFMKVGDRVKMQMFNQHGQSIFGAIDQKVAQFTPAEER
jgi:fumarylacetoacetate (FAA) hydrolase